MGVDECVQYIRDNFEKKYVENIENGLYDTRDLKRLQSNSTFASSYIQNQDRLDEAVDLVHISLKFRNEVKVNDLTESSFDKELFELGGVYFHNKDVNGHRILWLNVKIHRKDASPERLAAEKQGLVFAIEKAFNESPSHQIVVLIDMTSCGLANLDLDFVKYIITIFKSYYPTFLAYMLIYDMPWLFNAAWRVIKAWLSAEAVAKIKFVTKTDVQMYVKPEDLPPYMGGTDTFEYTYRPGISSELLYPEDKKIHFQEVQEYSSLHASSDFPFSSSTDLFKYDINANTPDERNQGLDMTPGNLNNSAVEKKYILEGFPGPGGFYVSLSGISADLSLRTTAVYDYLSVVLGQSQPISQNNTFVGRFLRVSPGDELIFHIRETGDSFDVITLTNTLPYPIAFKVKTTSPEKFRVRPSSGLIKPGKTEEVYVYLVPDHAGDVNKDKFLIMAMGAHEENVDPNQLFKDASKEKIMQHKLKCSIGIQESLQTKDRIISGVIKTVADPLISKVEQLEQQNRHMQKQLTALLVMQFLTILTLLVVIMSYSCFGEDLFTHFLALPFDFCQDTCGRKC